MYQCHAVALSFEDRKNAPQSHVDVTYYESHLCQWVTHERCMNVRYVLKNNNEHRVGYSEGKKKKRRGLVRAALSDGKAKDFTTDSVS